MVRVLIPTHLQDLHALAVAHVLRLKGHEPVLLYGSDFPTCQQASLSIEPAGRLAWGIEGAAIDLTNDHFDVVWYRRATPAILPEQMHPGDRKIAEKECRSFTRALWQILAPDAFWVNPLSSRERSLSKPVQLLEGKRAGLQVPPTLFSNSPEQIREFIREHDGNVIYKAFNPAQWDREEEGISLLFTSAVTIDDLPDDDVLSLSPGIFQPRMEKAYELRVTYMGSYQVAAKLLSQESAGSQLDWRATFTSADAKMRVERYDLPENVDLACRKLMANLGIVFGCFDFIVTPQGDYIFLEVNEMGQFLWIEEMNPEIPMLEPFTEFLISASPDFDWKPSDGMLLREFRSELTRRHVEDDFPIHLVKPNSFSVPDR